MAAKQGDAQSCLQVASRYATGCGVPCDAWRARLWLYKASRKDRRAPNFPALYPRGQKCFKALYGHFGGVDIEYTVADLWAVAVTPTEVLLAKRIEFLTHERQKTASCLSPCQKEKNQAADVQSVNKNAQCS
jgi:TPR repeat protein